MSARQRPEGASRRTSAIVVTDDAILLDAIDAELRTVVASVDGVGHVDAWNALRDGCYDMALVDTRGWCDDDVDFIGALRARRPDLAIVAITGVRRVAPEAVADAGASAALTREEVVEAGALPHLVATALEEARQLRRRETLVRWLERESRTDELTGLANRRAFEDRLAEVCVVSRAASDPVSIVLVETESTARINATWGTDAGDGMIRRVAACVRQSIRSTDFAARVGGDDFAVVLPRADLDLARLVARRIAQEIERLNQSSEDEVPISVLFALVTSRNASPEKMLAAADEQVRARKSQRATFVPQLRDFAPQIA
jgi:diguanylate cyclase (GGDEF)-like protein